MMHCFVFYIVLDCWNDNGKFYVYLSIFTEMKAHRLHVMGDRVVPFILVV